MSHLKATPLPIAFLLTSFAFLACNGGGGEGDATPVETPAPTPTSAQAATVTPTVVLLDDYLVVTLRFEAALARISADFGEALPESEEDVVQTKQAVAELESALSPLVEEAVETLAEVAPPPEAEAYHGALVNAFGDLESFAGDVAAALEPGTVIVLSPVVSDFTDLTIELGEVALEGQLLVTSALGAAGDDLVSTYLLAATERRVEMSRTLAEPSEELDRLLGSGDTSGALAVLEQLIASLEDLGDRWQQLSPPPEARDLHQRQGELIDEAVAVERLIHTAVRDQDQSVLAEAAEKSKETSILRDRLEADWNELLIEVLSR